MNNVVDDYVRTLAETYDSANDMRTVQITSEPGNDGLSLLGKMDREELDPVFRGAGHDFEIAVLTEQWDYESFYHHAEHGADTYGPVGGCPPSDDTYSADWANAPAI